MAWFEVFPTRARKRGRKSLPLKWQKWNKKNVNLIFKSQSKLELQRHSHKRKHAYVLQATTWWSWRWDCSRQTPALPGRTWLWSPALWGECLTTDKGIKARRAHAQATHRSTTRKNKTIAWVVQILRLQVTTTCWLSYTSRELDFKGIVHYLITKTITKASNCTQTCGEIVQPSTGSDAQLLF